MGRGPRSRLAVGHDHTHHPYPTAAVGAIGESPAPVGLEDGGEVGGYLSGLLDGQPEVGIGQGRDVPPLFGFLVAGSPGTPRPPPGYGRSTREPRWRQPP